MRQTIKLLLLLTFTSAGLCVSAQLGASLSTCMASHPQGSLSQGSNNNTVLTWADAQQLHVFTFKNDTCIKIEFIVTWQQGLNEIEAYNSFCKPLGHNRWRDVIIPALITLKFYEAENIAIITFTQP